MAYLDFRADAPLALPAPFRAKRAVLTRAEHDVLFLSRRDPRSSVAGRGAVRSRLRRLFGLSTPNRLADPRLEALRRFAVLLRARGNRLPATEEARLMAAGFDADQVAAVAQAIAREPGRRDAGRRGPLTALAAVAVALLMLMQRMLATYFNDGLVGLIGTLLATIAAVPAVRLAGRLVSPPCAAPAWSR